MIQIHNQLQRLILEKEKSVFNSRKMMENPSLYQEYSSAFTSSFSSEKTSNTKNNKISGGEEKKLENLETAEVSREEFLENVLLMESKQKRSNNQNLLIEEITRDWKEFSGKLRQSCKFDFKFEPEKYRVGTHSFRYTPGKNEVAWNTALKFLFNNAKKLIALQEKLQSLEIFGEM